MRERERAREREREREREGGGDIRVDYKTCEENVIRNVIYQLIGKFVNPSTKSKYCFKEYCLKRVTWDLGSGHMFSLKSNLLLYTYAVQIYI